MPLERRILILEDDKFIGSLIGGALRSEGFDSLLVSSILDAKKALVKFDPDVVIVDIDLGPGPSGLQFVQMLGISRPDVAAILLSKHPDAESAGFSSASIPDNVAYLRKSLVHDTSALLAAIESTVRGLGPAVRQDKEPRGRLDSLTKSQRSILHLMAQGYSNRQIADRKGVSLSNVEHRVNEIFKVFQLNQYGNVVPRVEAIRLYIAESGLPER
jgi:DNA-binding NarL/FixJ family response regulator